MSLFFRMVRTCLHCITWVSKFFVTQSRFAKGSKGFGSVVKQREFGQNVSLFFIAITICFMINESILKNSYRH